MTPRQADLLGYIRMFTAESGGVCPSFDEMAEALGVESKATISRLLAGLEAHGRIRRLRQRARAVEVVPDLAAMSTDALRRQLAAIVAELAIRGLVVAPAGGSVPQ